LERDRLVAFVDATYPQVLAAVAFACGDRSVAEDAVQEALAAAWVHPGRIEHLGTWVSRVALNRVRDAARRSSAERRAYERVMTAAQPSGWDGLTVEGALGPALRALPARQREAVALHYLLDMDVATTAAAMGVTTGTVKTCLHRARNALRDSVAVAVADDEEVDPVRRG